MMKKNKKSYAGLVEQLQDGKGMVPSAIPARVS
jgi:hypothetical protein